MTPAHEHQHGAGTDARLIRIALGLILGFMLIEIVVAFLARSLALLADAGHMLTDAAALATALWAIGLAARPATPTWSFGLKRAEILSAAVNGITLVAVSCVVTVQAVQRLVHPGEVGGPAVLTVALIGIVVNLLATWVLSRGNRRSLNVEGAFQHILTDAAGFMATALAGVVIILTGFARADAIASLVVVGLMAHAAWGLLAESGHILLEGAPRGIDLTEVRQRLLDVDPHVLDVHDLHAWLLTSDQPAMTAHVVVEDSCLSDGHTAELLDRLQDAMRDRFDMDHSTLQLERALHSEHEIGSH